MAHFGHGPVAVIGHALDHDRYSSGPVSLERHFLVGDPFELAGPLEDRVIDVLARHVRRASA